MLCPLEIKLVLVITIEPDVTTADVISAPLIILPVVSLITTKLSVVVPSMNCPAENPVPVSSRYWLILNVATVATDCVVELYRVTKKTSAPVTELSIELATRAPPVANGNMSEGWGPPINGVLFALDSVTKICALPVSTLVRSIVDAPIATSWSRYGDGTTDPFPVIAAVGSMTIE